ncbi:MAG TPA: phospholipase D family protein [Gemmatales bacterium]|nr:phospholipase D family protein [Gemmatales bacterium]HMP59050.1 phospholipase D family protein [Gemmatales bacterium]
MVGSEWLQSQGVFLSSQLLEGLLLGTGFTGALTLAWWVQWLRRRWWPGPSIKVYFSPKGGCADAIVAELNKARKEILVMAYSFTFDPIVNALIQAHKRGVTVKLLLDKCNEVDAFTDMPRCLGHGMNVRIDAPHAISHNKVMIVDRKVVITGSFNFTRQAETENAENVLVIQHHPALVLRYFHNFLSHLDHSRPPQPKDGAGAGDRGIRPDGTIPEKPKPGTLPNSSRSNKAA